MLLECPQKPGIVLAVTELLKDQGCAITNMDAQTYLKEGVIFATFSLLTQKKRGDKNKFVRVEQLVKWCGGEGYEGCLFFDEAHKAKNLYPTAGKDLC